jgi:polysaccharide export outer membrane protein
MMHNLLLGSFIAAMLLVSFPKSGAAQIGMQQMPGYPSGSSSSGAASRNMTEAPTILSLSELRVVPEDFARLLLAPGFLVGLHVLDDPDFAGTYRVDQQGDIALPTVGTVHVAGETASEARMQIRKQLLDDQILRDPQVDLNVLEYTAPQVTIIGEVITPGKFPLLVPRKLVDVLALAGGPTILAGDEVQITPASAESKSVLVHYSKGANPKTVEDVLVSPGDTLQVKRAGIVYVLGAVNRPGGYVMQEEGTLNVLQAMSLANGTSITASTKTIHLLRRNPDGTEVDIALLFKKITQGKRADVQLHATDVLFIPTSTMKAILTNSQSVLTAAASASIYAVATH